MDKTENYEYIFKKAQEKGFLININEWQTPASLYLNNKIGNARIIHSYYDKGFYNNYNVNGHDYFRVTKPISITELQLKEDSSWKTWMVDDPPHWWSMQNYSRNSYGNVLVAGLGLGLVTHELLNNVDVNLITVIEINKDVINLISPLLPEPENVKFEIINEDFYNFINITKIQFNRIIVDLWVTDSKEETMKVLDEEVEPLAYYLKELFPDASLVFHGFGLEID